jgi:amino acid adenylation domain-containing protein
MNANYSILVAQHWEEIRTGNRAYACNPNFWSISNRVSYTLDFNGPSLTVDSACSSSLTAIHLACESILRGECEIALAGGVNLILHPAQLDGLSRMNMLSKSGNCHSFGADADGFTDGEGVGSVLLKPLKQAIADNDNIYAVIAASGLNSGGKTSGYTVPNPNAQATLIDRIIQRAGINPENIAYIEAHGTGTFLGDPIEIRGLTKAFEKYTGNKQFCAIGSVKSNIGHLESAAGISALTKVLLQFKHNQLVPSINSEQTNPNIRFENTPFYVQNTLSALPRDKQYYVGISSFGAGGSNAHLLVKNHVNHAEDSNENTTSPYLIFLSAQTKEQLSRSAGALLGHLETHRQDSHLTLENIAFTLTTGRVELSNRLAIVAFDLSDLIEKLQHYIESSSHRAGIFFGEASEVGSPEPAEIKSSNLDILDTLAQRWVKGEIQRPSAFFQQGQARRLSLPGYPFARERYWIQIPKAAETYASVATPSAAVSTPKPDLLYFSSKWSEAALPARKANQGQQHSVFLVEDPTMAEQFDTAGDHTWLYPEADNMPAGNQLYTKNKHGFYGALDETLAKRKDNLHFVFAWTNNSIHNNYQGLRALLWLSQYILDKRLETRARLTVWHATDANLQDLHGFAYAGFVKSLHVEKPQLSVKHICFIGRNAQPLSKNTQYTLLQKELDADATECIVKYDSGKRFVEKIVLQTSVTEARTNKVLQPGSTYLITGGAGGLGRVIARQLSRQGKFNIILTGRSVIDKSKQAFLEELREHDNEAVYFSCDVTDKYDVDNLFEKINGRFGQLNGIIHSAGIVNDCLLQNKQWDDFYKLVTTKTQAVINLDTASEDQPLDFFITFSSISAMLGNIGQTDYAYANCYMDHFIQWRNNLVEIGERQGQGITINWPLWSEGGMQVAPAILQAIEEQIGVLPLQTAMGIQSFMHILGSNVPQVAPVYGYADRIINYLNTNGYSEIDPQSVKPSGLTAEHVAKVNQARPNNHRQLREALLTELTDVTSTVLDIAADRIHNDTVLGDFGFDSITLQEFAQQLKSRMDIAVSPALFFSKNTLAKLADHLLESYIDILVAHYADNSVTNQGPANAAAISESAVTDVARPQHTHINEVAIIGAAGILPGAKDLEEFWHNLENSIDSIQEIPQTRWNWQDYYGDAFGSANKSISKWGGFIEDVDKFDYAFFDVSQREANFMDPQQRLFLQTSWHALENAGYDPTSFAGKNVGVFTGVEFSDYKDLLDQYGQFHAEMPIGNAQNMIPNRVSYFLDLRGPSESIDTACSSSLTAINQAVRSLQSGESCLAIAGGISLTLSPKTMIGTSQLNIYSPDGLCRTLDESANGYVKGEGVGVVILKPLQQAVADGDNIMAVIKNCSVNHGGRSNSITAPNPDAQTELLFDAYYNANIDPDRIAYIEMHGTGTNLGDPVEVEGIRGAFQKLAKVRGTSLNGTGCGIGSVKTNIGHLEPAAGVAGVLKMLLALQHQKLPASLHFKKLNPLITFENSPLYVVDQPQPLPQTTGQPAIVGVSSFGFGGSNVHLVLEQWQAEPEHTCMSNTDEMLLFPVSAKSSTSLKQACTQLIDYIKSHTDLPLTQLAYTLQIGRTDFDLRFACVACQHQELLDGLLSYVMDKPQRNCFNGDRKHNAALLEDLEASDFHLHLLQKTDTRLLAKWWATGLEIDWQQHYTQSHRKRLVLPGYPFAKTSCWVPSSDTIKVAPIKAVKQKIQPNLPRAEINNHSEDNPEPETNPVAEHILARVAELSGKARTEIQHDQNLALDLGLDSIKMMGLINELISISSDEHVSSFNKLGMNTIINRARTFGELLDLFCDADVSTPYSSSQKQGEKHRVSVDLLDAQSVFVPAYFLTKSSSLCTYVEIEGKLNLTLANQAWQTLIERHPSLQLQFHWPTESPATLGDIHASFVKDYSNLQIDVTDISDQLEDDQRVYIEQFFHNKLNHHWSLDQWPLHCFDLIRLNAQSYVLFWSNEHIISDGLSNQTAIREFLRIYEALQTGTELEASTIPTREEYIELVRQINSFTESYEKCETPVKEDNTYVFNPNGATKNLKKCHYCNHSLSLTSVKTAKLKKAAADRRINLNTLLTCLFAKTLSRFDATTGSVLLQVPTSGRSYDEIHIGDTIGCFAQNLTLAINVNQPLAQLAPQIEQSVHLQILSGIDKQQTRSIRSITGAFPLGNNHSLPEHTLEMLLDNIKSNLYFPYTGDTGIAASYGDIKVAAYRAGTSNSPGAIDFLQEIHNNQLHIFVNYDQSFFSAPTIQELMNCYLICIDELLSEVPQQPQPKSVHYADATVDSKLLDSLHKVSGKELSIDDFERDLELDIGVDSLVKIRLISGLQSQFDTRINKAQLARCRTLSEMSLVLQDNQPQIVTIPGHADADVETVPDILGVEDLPIKRIIQQCLATPEATAVSHFNGASITYRQLHEQSNRIANLLIDLGVKNGDYIGVVTHRGPKMITAIVAVLKCGAAYVPMDPIFPADRKAYIINHARIKTVLSEAALTQQLLDAQAADDCAQNGEFNRIVLLDNTDSQTLAALDSNHIDVFQANDWQDYPGSLPLVEISPEDDMVVLFTSGSTGNPKGVYLHHLGYANRILWHQIAFKLKKGEKVAQKTSCSFDVSIWEHLWPIMYGGVVCAVEKDTVTNPWEFADWLIREKIAIAHFVPSMFGEFVNAIAKEGRQFSDLRWLIFSGEALPTATVQNWIDHFGLDTGLCNLYGPTEASIDVSYHYINRRPQDNEAIPIGKALDNTVLFVRGEDGERLPIGEMGELIIGGKQLAKGYLYEPHLTANAFIPNTYPGVPGDVVYRTGDLAIEREGGVFEYHGRLDSQVKLRGFRVELGEIENVVACHPLIDEAAVLLVNNELALWYSGNIVNVDEIKQFICDKCPSYMVPQIIEYLPRLPKNANGKLDRKALLSMDIAQEKQKQDAAASADFTRLPLTPAQQWVFSYFDSPYEWWGVSQQKLPDDFNEELFSQVLSDTVKRHEALRTRFVATDKGGYEQEIFRAPGNIALEQRQLTSSGMAFKQDINEEIRAIATDLKPDQWPLVRVIVYVNSEGYRQLVWVAHHLISDMLSGYIVDREIWDSYNKRQAGRYEGSLLPAVPQISDYIQALQSHFDTSRVNKAKEFWNKYAKKRRTAVQVPTDHRLGENNESSGDSFVQRIPGKLVHHLETDGRQYFETSLYNLLAAGLYKLIAQVTRRSWVVISHKLNGRTMPQSNSNYFTSVGNFAINVPVGISVQKSISFTHIVEQLCDELETLPAGGLGYDWLSSELPESIYPDNKLTGIRINYLGDVSSTAKSEGVSKRIAPADQKRTCMMEFFLYTKNKEMFLEISYSSNFYTQETVEGLANRYIKQLISLSDEFMPELIHTN